MTPMSTSRKVNIKPGKLCGQHLPVMNAEHGAAIRLLNVSSVQVVRGTKGIHDCCYKDNTAVGLTCRF